MVVSCDKTKLIIDIFYNGRGAALPPAGENKN